MLRHSRLHARNARERYITRRRRQFTSWCDYDPGLMDEHGRVTQRLSGGPRSPEVYAAEFWSGWRLGKLAKWNGACSCGMCRDRKTRQDRTAAKAELRKILEVA